MRFTEAVKMGGKLVIKGRDRGQRSSETTKGIRNQGCLQMDLEELGRQGNMSEVRWFRDHAQAGPELKGHQRLWTDGEAVRGVT